MDTCTDWQLSDGEINFLYWFIDGSIMIPDTRWRLRRAWGFCERHAWSVLAVEAAFRHGYLHGPAVLYADIMQRALAAFPSRGPLLPLRVVASLRATGPCLICELGVRETGRGSATEDRLKRGRDMSFLQDFARGTSRHWRQDVCGRCVGGESSRRCRPHLLQDAAHGSLGSIAEHRALVERITSHMVAFERSFCWDFRDTETDEDRAALISAVGWCSGWRPIIALVKDDSLWIPTAKVEP